MDFFEQANGHVRELNDTERKIFEYVIHNVDSAKDMQIRTLAAQCFVSTTTIMRFARKLGFDGYREFSDSLRLASSIRGRSEIPSVLGRQTYKDEYLKNIIESVHVLQESRIRTFRALLESDPAIYCLGNNLDREVARYACQVLIALGYRASCIESTLEEKAALGRLRNGDVLFLVSLSGEDPQALNLVEKAQLRCHPAIVSITQSANNTLQSLTDLDLYVFVDRIIVDDRDLSARGPMFALVELLAHSLIQRNTGSH